MKLITRIGALASTSILLVGLGGCAAGAPSADGGQVTIDWAFWNQGDAANATWAELAEEVTAQYPDITVKLTQPPFADYFTKLQSQLAAGDAPCIVSMQSLRLPTFAGALEPLDGYSEQLELAPDEWTPSSLEALQSDGKQYAIPFGFSTAVLYYNADLFEQAGVDAPGPDWTIDDFENAAQTITRETGTPGFGQSFSDLHMFSMLLAHNGAVPVSPDGTLDLTTPEMEEAFSWYTGLATKQQIASTPASASDVPWGEQQFGAGNAAMAVDLTSNFASIAADTPFRAGVVPLPQGPDGGGTFAADAGFGISKTCEHKEAAAKAIAILTGAESSAAAAASGRVPARIADLPVFFGGLEAATEETDPGFAAQAEDAYTRSAAFAQPFVSTESWDQTTKQIARQFLLSYSGSQSPADSLAAVQSAAK